MKANALKWICTHIWNFSEWAHVPLGRLGPIVFFHMIGAKSMKKVKS